MSMHAFSHSSKVVVIGAGLSGLTAAYRLQEKGHDVAVYEARNRVGGRVFTVKVAGYLAELGGQNILDGGEAENMIALINELGLQTEEKKVIFNVYYDDQGELMHVPHLIKERGFTPDRLRTKLEEIGETAQNMREVLLALFDAEDPLFKACCAFLSGYEGASVEKLSVFNCETLYHLLMGGLSATHPHTGEEEIATIDHLMVKGGNSLLTEKLAETLGDRVHLKHVLRAIERNADGSYLLTFENGKHTSADVLVLTLPCPVYRDISISDDVIPRERRLEIESLHYGTNEKILALNESSRSGVFSNGRIITFDNRDRHVINLYYIGEHGKFTSKTLKEMFQRELPFLQKVYSYTPSVLPVIALDRAFASYEGPVGHCWSKDPFAKGSYSCIGAGQEEQMTSTVEVAGETVKTLFAPLHNSLFFAGEHTTTFLDFIGTMEAAVESGEKVVRLIDKQLRLSLKCDNIGF